MIHPIIWALINAHPFLAYGLVALFVALVWAYAEGKWSDESNGPSGFVLLGPAVWPISLPILAFVGVIWLLTTAFESGKKKRT
jgi:hypothetical protein